jgi:HTH-type transcriptional regulator / antitoxin HipB
MQKITKTKARKRGHGTRVGRPATVRAAKTRPFKSVASARSARRKPPVSVIANHAYLEQGGRATHVLVPIEEYERLIRADAVNTTSVETRGDTNQWIDADEFALQLAGERIAAARRFAGLTQKQLAAKLSVPQSQISRIERQPDHLTVRTLKRVAQALGVNVSALVP